MSVLNGSIKVFLLVVVMAINCASASEQVYTSFFSSKAVSGYDVVAYFSENKAVQGSSSFTMQYKDADWYFINQKNLDKFKENPDYFAPQYGGYCAWAMAENKNAPGNVPYWTIYQDKLYINYDQTVQTKWLADKDNFIKKAAKNWAKMDLE